MKQRLRSGYRPLVWVGIVVIPLILLSTYFYTIHAMMVPGHSMAPAEVMRLRMAATLILLSSVFTGIFLCYAVMTRSNLPELIKNGIFSATILLTVLLSAECFFLYYEKSDGVGVRWSGKIWGKKYLNHRSYFHYPDSKGIVRWASFREPVFDLKRKKKPVWFIGDSFTFGFGIEQTAQTFPALVEKQLGGQIESVNLGDGGADTYQEKETLFAYDSVMGQKPYAVVWQYFGNDIDSADTWPGNAGNAAKQNGILKFGNNFFRARSFLTDFIFWEYLAGNDEDNYTAYVNFLKGMYQADSFVVNGKVQMDSSGYETPYKQHLIPLKESAEYYKSKGTRFLVVIFPYLWKDGPETAEALYARRLENELKEDGTDVINVTPLVSNITVEKRVVNPHDPHPSVLVDKLVADTIASYFRLKYGL